MPASDLRLRNTTGILLINEFQKLFERAEADPSLNLYLVTKYRFNERDGTAEVFKLKQAVQATIRNYTALSAIGVIENQAFINYPENQKGKSLSVHALLLCWGTSNDISKHKKRAKGFKSSITKLPLHSQKVNILEGSVGRVGRYMMKPPYEGKAVNFEKLEKAWLFKVRKAYGVASSPAVVRVFRKATDGANPLRRSRRR